MERRNIPGIVRSYHDIGGIQLVGKGLITKVRTILDLYPTAENNVDVGFNGESFTVSTEYPPIERWYKYSQGVAEPGAKRVIRESLTTGDCFVDIGAQCGDTALYALSLVGEEGEVHAFEPTTYWYSILAGNIERNEIENITSNNAAVGESSGRLSPEEVVGGRHELMESTFEQTEVEVRSLDSYISKKGITPDLIQIDVDGAELEVLKGAKDQLGKVPIILELHHQEILQAWEETVDLILDSCSIFYLEQQGELPNLHPFLTEITSKDQLRPDTVCYLLLK